MVSAMGLMGRHSRLLSTLFAQRVQCFLALDLEPFIVPDGLYRHSDLFRHLLRAQNLRET